METNIEPKFKIVSLIQLVFQHNLKFFMQSTYFALTLIMIHNCLIFSKLNAEIPNISNEGSSSDLNSKNNFETKSDPTKPKKSFNQTNLPGNYFGENTTDLLNLSLILINGNDKIARINQRNLKEKDQIAGLEIITIKDNKVLLQPTANHDSTIEEQLNAMAANSQFIKNHIRNKYVEINLPKIINKHPMITFDEQIP